MFNKREDTIQRSFGKVKSTQSLVLSPMIDSEDEDELADADEEEKEIQLMLEDEPELPAADVVSSAKKFLSVLMKSHHIASKKIVFDTSGRARPRKVPAMATRAHNLLAYALLRTTCQRCSAERQRARMQEAKAKAKEDAEAKVKGKEKGTKQKKKGAGEKGKGKVTSKRKGKDNQESKVDGEDPASLFRLLLTNGDADENSLLTEVSVW